MGPAASSLGASGGYRSCGEMVLKHEVTSAQVRPVSLGLDLNPSLWPWGVGRVCKALL